MDQKTKTRNWAAALEFFRHLLEGNPRMAQAVLEQMQGVSVVGEDVIEDHGANPEVLNGGNPEQKL